MNNLVKEAQARHDEVENRGIHEGTESVFDIANEAHQNRGELLAVIRAIGCEIAVWRREGGPEQHHVDDCLYQIEALLNGDAP